MGHAGHQFGRRAASGAVAALVAAAAWPAAAPAQLRVVNGVVVNGDGTDANRVGFMTRKQPAAVVEAIDDFERYREHKVWEKAFAALAKVGEAGGDRLLLSKDGLAVPPGVKVRRELLSLPPDGRQAYRLFNDPKAQQLFKQATATPADPTAPPTDDVPLLRKIVDQYFVTSVGDQAADRLGDALFEAGDYGAAESYWRMIVDDYPDTTLSPALLQVKRAVALADLGRTESFAELRAVVRDRYAGQRVTVGGRDVDAAAYVDGLAARAGRSATTGPATPDGPPLVLPTSDEPAWQVPLMDGDTAKLVESRLVNFGWGRMAGQLLAAVPPTVVDARRAYVNWFGAVIAVDLATGKLLWRTASPTAVAEAIAVGATQGNPVQPDSYALVLVGDRLLSVGHPPPAPPNGNANNPAPNPNASGAPLDCLATDTGKRVWSTSAGPTETWTFVGPPMVDGDVIHAVATEGGGNNNNGSVKQEYTLLTLGLADGALRSKVALGTPQFPVDNYRGRPMPRPPVLMVYNGRVLVLTNDGAVLAVDAKESRLDWAYAFDAKAEGQDNYYYGYAIRPPADGPAAMLMAGSTLYLKDRGVNTLHTIDLSAGPVPKHTRPIDADVGLVRLRDGQLLVLGASAEGIDVDAEGQPMRWSNVLSVATGETRPLLAGGHMYVFGKRGVHDVDLAHGADAGPIFRGSDRDSDGGLVLRAGGRLITVSSANVTAYPLGTAAGGH